MENPATENKKEFKMNSPEYGAFGGGTQKPEYFNKKGEKVPFRKTKWAKKAKESRVINSLKKG